MMSEEIWKPIDGYPWYQVSNKGNVRSCARNWADGEWRPVKQYDHQRGYKAVLLKRKNEKNYKNFLVHRLVAIAFLGGDHPDQEVNHINGDKHDNRVDNLEWCTREQNRRHAIDNGLYNTDFIASRTVLCVETGQVFIGVRETARQMFGNVKFAKHISAVCRGEHKTCKGYHFKYINPKSAFEAVCDLLEDFAIEYEELNMKLLDIEEYDEEYCELVDKTAIGILVVAEQWAQSKN